MAYVLGGSNSESYGFEKAIANFAIRAVHESSGLVNYTSVVTPNQGNTFEIPLWAPITFADYNPAGSGGTIAGDASYQNPALGQGSITATPAVASTAFDIFYGWTTSFPLAATIGAEIGESFAEKVDQRVANAFLSFKVDAGNTNYSSTPADGYARPTQLGAMDLLVAGANVNNYSVTAGFTATTVLQMIRNVKQNWMSSRLPGSPVIVLDSQISMARLLGELTGGAVTGNVSDLGNELLRTGGLQNLYGCTVVFTSFLKSAVRDVGDGSPHPDCYVGAYFSDQALYTVMKQGLEIKMGEAPGGLQEWVTGVAYMGAGVADLRRGGAINVCKTA